MSPMTLVKDAANCSGCGACMTVCPTQAITMEADQYGCLYPRIDENACVQCGKCMGVCGYQKPVSGAKPFAAYAAAGNNDALVQESASGGVFASLAKGCLADGGVIAGAVLDCAESHADVYHVLSDRMEDLHRMQGSKYVQSEAWRCYRDILQAVKAGKTVLFSGTPCQVVAVKQLTGDPENLITMDLVCHGVPPVQMLNDYMKILGKWFGGRITQFRFRDKSSPKNFCARIGLRKKKRESCFLLRSQYISFYKFFLDGSIHRENCYCCPHASLERVADITIGDYWGIDAFHGADIAGGRMPSRKDWSCVLVNTEKGARFLERYADELYLVPTEVSWVAQNNQQLNRPSEKNEKRDMLLQNYVQSGYGAVEASFIKGFGGSIPFYWRMLKNLRVYKKAKNFGKE